MKHKCYSLRQAISRMRHLRMLVVILTVILITGCSSNPNIITEANAPSNLGEYNEFEDIGKINEIKNGLTPNTKSNKQYKPNNTMSENNNQDTSQNSNPEGQETELEELTKMYDSAIMKTSLGDIKIKFYGDESPITVNNFMNLAKKGFYNGTLFHRVIDNFMIQAGDPNSKNDDWSTHGTGGPGYKFQDEFNSHKLVKGSFAMANSGPNTNGSQFFIVTAEETSWLDGKHTNFGEVVEGMDTVLKIEAVEKDGNDHPLNDIIINSIELFNSSSVSTPVGPENPAEDSNAGEQESTDSDIE